MASAEGGGEGGGGLFVASTDGGAGGGVEAEENLQAAVWDKSGRERERERGTEFVTGLKVWVGTETEAGPEEGRKEGTLFCCRGLGVCRFLLIDSFV